MQGMLENEASGSSRRSIYWFFTVYLCLYTLSILYIWVRHASGQRWGFLTLGLTAKYDLLCFVERYRFFRKPGFFNLEGQPFNYPAFAAVILRPFYGESIPPESRYFLVFLTASFLSSCIFVASLVKRGMRTVVATGLAASAMFSFPILLMLYLNNAEILVWVFLTLGVWACCKKHFWIAALCFGLGAALKYYPILLLALFLRKGQWSKAVGGALAGLVASVLSLQFLGPSISGAYAGLKSQLPRFASYYLQTWHTSEGSIDHSLYGYVKLLAVREGRPDILQWTLPLYLVIVSVAVSVLYFMRIRKQAPLNQLLALMVVCIWLSPLSADYTLVNLIPVMGAFVSYAWGNSEPQDVRLLVPVFICFAVLLAPIYFLTVGGIPYQGPIRCLVLAFLLLLTLQYDLQNRSFIDVSLTQRNEPTTAAEVI